MRKVKNHSIVVSSYSAHEPISKESLFVKAFCKMDIEGLANLLNENIEYADDNKWLFVEDLRNKMEFFKLRYDTYFQSSRGLCTGCSIGKEILIFKGNHSGVDWSFCLESENGVIKSINECATFNPSKEWLT